MLLVNKILESDRNKYWRVSQLGILLTLTHWTFFFWHVAHLGIDSSSALTGMKEMSGGTFSPRKHIHPHLVGSWHTLCNYPKGAAEYLFYTLVT